MKKSAPGDVEELLCDEILLEKPPAWPLPDFERVSGAKEFIYLQRGTLLGTGVLIFAKGQDNLCSRYASLTFRTDAYVYKGQTLRLVDGALLETRLEAAREDDPHASLDPAIEVMPARTPHLLFDDAISLKQFNRLMWRLRVRLQLSDRLLQYRSYNHTDLICVRMPGSEDLWLHIQGRVSHRSGQIGAAILSGPGAGLFNRLTES